MGIEGKEMNHEDFVFLAIDIAHKLEAPIGTVLVSLQNDLKMIYARGKKQGMEESAKICEVGIFKEYNGYTAPQSDDYAKAIRQAAEEIK